MKEDFSGKKCRKRKKSRRRKSFPYKKSVRKWRKSWLLREKFLMILMIFRIRQPSLLPQWENGKRAGRNGRRQLL